MNGIKMMPPKYQTAYACEGKKLTIECESGDLINLIRANYGRFSITICNDHGNMEWSVNCMFPKSLTVLNSRCAHKQSCSVLAATNMFGDPCPGTHKYLEAHYQCISPLQTSTTTNRPSPPPWVLANNSPVLSNATSSSSAAGILPPPLQPALSSSSSSSSSAEVVARDRDGGIGVISTASTGSPTTSTTLHGGRVQVDINHTALKSPSSRYDAAIGTNATPTTITTSHRHPYLKYNNDSGGDGRRTPQLTHYITKAPNVPYYNLDIKSSNGGKGNDTTPPNSRLLSGVGGMGNDNDISLNGRGVSSSSSLPAATSTLVTSYNQKSYNNNLFMGATGAIASGGGGSIRSINNINNLNKTLAIGKSAGRDEDESNIFCGSTNARNLFWNMTRVGEVNVQPCPGGATGVAKWRCVLIKRIPLATDVDVNDVDNLKDGVTTTPSESSSSLPQCNGSLNCETSIKMNLKLRNFEPTWHPLTPDLTQCRSLWLNNLEVRVNQRDSSLISIANDLSEVTSSKTLYGGDMLVTTKIIQKMSEKMYHDKETFPDQRLREAMILELLQGVVKTGSNLLDESQLSSWLDLNQEDQMRVATSLLIGLEDNAFLLADTIIRERNIIQKVKNILLSVRVLETKNIQNSEIFPDVEQWQISDDHIELPRAALIENSEGGLVRIVFAAFDRLESILKPSYDHFDLKNSRSYIRNTVILANETDTSFSNSQQQQRIRILNSKVISASLGKGRHIQLSQPIKLILRHLQIDNVTNPTCVFWNYIDHAWSANGCALESTNRTHSICICNHLTNFAILMDILDDHSNSLFTMFDGNMRVLIYISITICLVFIVIALLTLKIFNGVFIKSARTLIYRSIYICLLLIELLFFIGIEQTETSIVCGFTTVFLHCTTLTIVAWFCFEAFQSYTTLTTDDIVLEVDQTSKVNCYYLLSYGLSFTIVAISLAIQPSTYTQNDYCVLMEANTLFYSTFVTPIILFVVGGLIYTFLSWVIMYRKCRSTLKNKEHARLTNVRFDIRCSFTFLLLLCITWLMAYWYLRYSKMGDDVAEVYGYLFITFNTLMGVYIFIFHCIQNEKIRHEYRKYVRHNSWLPKCLRCSKTSISSGIVGGSGCIMTSTTGGRVTTAAAAMGSLNNSTSPSAANIKINTVANSTTTLHGKKSKSTVLNADDDDYDENEGTARCNNNSPTEDAVMISISSDCKFNELNMRVPHRLGAVTTIANNNGPGNIGMKIASGGNIILQPNESPVQSKGEQSLLQNPAALERNSHNMSAVMDGVDNSGTIRSTSGLRTPNVVHTSPTLSISSSYLMFNYNQCNEQQQTPQVQPAVSECQQESFYHQTEYSKWPQKMRKNSQMGDFPGSSNNNSKAMMSANGSDGHQQLHDFLYWTQKPSQSHTKKKRGGVIGSSSPSGSLHSRNTPSSHSQQVLMYSSYKKATLKNQHQQQKSPHQQKQQRPEYPHYAEAFDTGTLAYYKEQQRNRIQSHQEYLQKQQLSSDEEQVEPAAHVHLLQQINQHICNGGVIGGQGRAGPIADFGISSTNLQPTQYNYYNRNKHSNCDSSQQQSLPIQVYDRHTMSDNCSDSGDTYYNQGSFASDTGPVYEEILSNRTSDIQHYNVDDMLPHDYEDGHNVHTLFQTHQRQQRLSQRGDVRSLHNYPKNEEFNMIDQSDDNASSYSDQEVNVLDDEYENDDGGSCEGADEEDNIDNNTGNMNLHNHRHHHCHHRKGREYSQSDERMQRLMAIQGADFDKRFQRHLRKNRTAVHETSIHALPPAYNEFQNIANHCPPQQRQSQQQQQQLTVFDRGTGTGVSMSSFKRTTAAALGASPPTTGIHLAVNEPFNHAPPLPPANQNPLNKKSLSVQQQPQQQQPQTQHQHKQISPQNISNLNNISVGRNISAMLDENNTVRSYLEPLNK